MKTYEYEILKMEPVSTDVDAVENLLNQKGEEGYRFIAVQKFWTQDDYGQAIQRNFLVLERENEDEI